MNASINEAIENDVNRSAIKSAWKLTSKKILKVLVCILGIVSAIALMSYIVFLVGIEFILLLMVLIGVVAVVYTIYEDALMHEKNKLGANIEWYENREGSNPRASKKVRVRYKNGTVKKEKDASKLNWSTGGENPITHFGLKKKKVK